MNFYHTHFLGHYQNIINPNCPIEMFDVVIIFFRQNILMDTIKNTKIQKTYYQTVILH